jgi:oligogalacturonide lyase
VNLSRRTFAISALGASLAGPARAQFSPIRRFLDSSTEVELLCLSDPSRASYLPFTYNRSNSSRHNFVIYASEGPSGSGAQAHRLELKGGILKPLTAASALHPRALALSPDDKTLYFADGDTLHASSASSLSKPRELYKASSPGAFKTGFSLSEDGAAIVLLDGEKLVSIPVRGSGKPVPQFLAETGAVCHDCIATKGNAILFRDPKSGIHLFAPGSKPQRLPLEDKPGELGPAIWNPDGRSFLFLRTGQGRGVSNSLHEYSLDTKQESLVGKTSQFVDFNRNGDSSVFVGASGSKAQPYVLLMLRITRRELALCEHKSSDATQVSPVFSPSSKRIFFQSDRLGKSAIFSVAVEKLVEPTEAGEETKKT